MATAQDAQRRLLRAFRALVAVTCVLGIVAVVATFQAFRKHGEWAPLRPYAVQKVLNVQRFVRVDSPTLRVKATKCLAAGVDEPVKVHGVRQYQLLLPPGTSISDGNGTSVRYPAGVTPPRVNEFQPPVADDRGCVHAIYENPLPQAVIDRSARVCRETGLPSLWKLTGSETPEADGREGVTRTWETEPFRVACA